MEKFKNFLYWLIFVGSTLIVLIIIGIILFDIFSRGASVISWEFLFTNPSDGMTKGGILPAIIGTVVLTLITTIVSVPFGISCAIYLSEYAEENQLTSLIRASIRNLAGVPSIIYGLFGLALFVKALHFNVSVLSAGLTLGLLSLPYIITTSEEAIKSVPRSMKEAALALGATQFESIRDVVIPKALPGIMTGVILSISRAAGETAPIMFTGVAFYINSSLTSLQSECMALPYHIYIMSTQHFAIETVRPIAYGTTLVLVAIVFLMNIVAFYIRYKYRN